MNLPTVTTRPRAGINYPKFADKFALLDFNVEPMPAISLYPVPDHLSPGQLYISVSGLECKPRVIPWSLCDSLPRVMMKAPLICQIFNWVEEVEWEGVRLADFLDYARLETHPEGYYSIHSADGVYFESLSMDEARDPRTILATSMNGEPLPQVHGGPLRLVVPFLQGYKSIKWVSAIRATRHDPVGIKRLLAQSKTAKLAPPWLKRYGIVPPSGKAGDPDE